MRFRLVWLTEWGFGLCFAAILFFFCRHLMFSDPGTQWHTVTGERILQQGFTTTDQYSHTFAGKEWIPSQWLAEVGMAKLFAHAQWDGLLWGSIAVLSILMAWLGGRAIRSGCHPILAGLLICVLFACMAYHIHVRPHILTMLFLALFFGLLIDIEAGRLSLYHLAWVVPISICWVNVHGGVMAGWGTLGIVCMLWLARTLFKRPSPVASRKHFLFLVLLGVITAATVLVNPYGWGLVRMWQVIMQADLPNLISEHRPLDFSDVTGMAVLANFLLYLFVWAGTWKQPQRVVWWVPLLWFGLAYSRIRHGPLFGLIAGLAIIDMLPHCYWMHKLAKKSDLILLRNGTEPSSPAVLSWLACLFPLVCVLIPSFGVQGHANLNPDNWPLQMMPELKTELSKPNVVLFNDDRFGGFLIRHFPNTKVFLDDRCELYGEKFIADFADAKRDRSPNLEVTNRWLDTWIERHGINVALVVTEEDNLFKVLSKRADWKLVKETKVASLFVRNDNAK